MNPERFIDQYAARSSRMGLMRRTGFWVAPGPRGVRSRRNLSSFQRRPLHPDGLSIVVVMPVSHTDQAILSPSSLLCIASLNKRN